MRCLFLLTLVLAAAGCTDRKDKESTLTKRERDSIIGESVLPGASGVRRALGAVDSAAARRAREAEIR